MKGASRSPERTIGVSPFSEYSSGVLPFSTSQISPRGRPPSDASFFMRAKSAGSKNSASRRSAFCASLALPLLITAMSRPLGMERQLLGFRELHERRRYFFEIMLDDHVSVIV